MELEPLEEFLEEATEAARPVRKNEGSLDVERRKGIPGSGNRKCKGTG